METKSPIVSAIQTPSLKRQMQALPIAREYTTLGLEMAIRKAGADVENGWIVLDSRPVGK